MLALPFTLRVEAGTSSLVQRMLRIAAFLQTLGFTSTRSDASLFVYHHGVDTAYLLLYVEDIILTASTVVLL